MRRLDDGSEPLETYLDRKNEELKLLSRCLSVALPLPRPASVNEVIEGKFKLAAALKSEHALQDWAHTETAWTHAGRMHVGPFEFKYDYQRADLEVRGPGVYPAENLATADTVYTSSGMAAIAAVLLASRHLISEADILAFPDSYGETQELIENHVRHLRLVPVTQLPGDKPPSSRSQILLFDSCMPAATFEAVLRHQSPRLDLLVFDTTCFSANSGRIRRVLRWAKTWQIPAVLVRSHTKLDSLGVEYGRLGSIVFATSTDGLPMANEQILQKLATETRNAVRLIGGAANPAHFPPFVGTQSYRALTNQRIAAILRNGRRAARYFAAVLPEPAAELHFAHGLYVMLMPEKSLDERGARQLATDLSADLGKAGMPVRHAGSFGFDFAAAEWCYHGPSKRYAVRIAVGDLPTCVWDDVIRAVARWWAYEGRPGFHR